MYAGKQAFHAIGILIISIMILCFVRYSRKNTEGFVGGSWTNSCSAYTNNLYDATASCRMANGYDWMYTSINDCELATNNNGSLYCTQGRQCTSGTNYNSSSGRVPCTACPANSLCTITGFTCNSGYTRSGSSCVEVKCPAGQYVNGSVCAACPSGTYQSQANFTGNSCKAWPPTNRATQSATAVTCLAGYTLSADGTQCDANPCASGTYSTDGSGKSPCVNCPTTGATCTASGFTCQTGYTRSGNTCSPNPCAIGQYSSSGSSPCTACSTGYTTTTTGSTSQTSCTNTISVTDILNQLNYSPTNLSGKFYNLTAANINVTSPQTVTQGQTINYTSYVTPASLVTQSITNYANGTTYNLTNSSGRAVNSQGSIRLIIQTLPPYTKGSIQNLNTSANCSGSTPDTCTISYNNPSGGSQLTTNPCSAMNAWYDFDKGFCVDNNGIRVTSTKTCSDSSIYNNQVNACISVQQPVFKNQPPNTTGIPSIGDYRNCITINGGDCQPVYTLGLSKTTTNPCSGSTPIYDFGTHSCKPSVTQTQQTSCCSLGVSVASTRQACLPYINSISVKNTSKCASKPNICCNSQAYSTNQSCINNGYWQVDKSFKAGSCPISGFIDMGEDTMQTKRFKWAQKRQLLNAP